MSILFHKTKWSKSIFIFVFLSLLASLIFSVVQLFQVPAEEVFAQYERTRSDYTLVVVECLLGLIAMFLPSVLAKRMEFSVPTPFMLAYVLFLYCAIYLGEMHSFYYRVPHFDTLLHGFSGAALAILGFFVVRSLNHARQHKIKLSPIYVSFFAFCFSVMLGTVWEIYEFIIDGVFALNMQKFITNTGEVLIGRNALVDTMKDLIVDVCSAAIVTFSYYFYEQRKQSKELKAD